MINIIPSNEIQNESPNVSLMQCLNASLNKHQNFTDYITLKQIFARKSYLHRPTKYVLLKSVMKCSLNKEYTFQK